MNFFLLTYINIKIMITNTVSILTVVEHFHEFELSFIVKIMIYQKQRNILVEMTLYPLLNITILFNLKFQLYLLNICR